VKPEGRTESGRCVKDILYHATVYEMHSTEGMNAQARRIVEVMYPHSLDSADIEGLGISFEPHARAAAINNFSRFMPEEIKMGLFPSMTAYSLFAMARSSNIQVDELRGNDQ
jgi:hypothetical protein